MEKDYARELFVSQHGSMSLEAMGILKDHFLLAQNQKVMLQALDTSSVFETDRLYDGKELALVFDALGTIAELAPGAVERTAQLANMYLTQVLDELTMREKVRIYWLEKNLTPIQEQVDNDKSVKNIGRKVEVDWIEERKELEERLKQGYALPHEDNINRSAAETRNVVLYPVMKALERMAVRTYSAAKVRRVAECLDQKAVLDFAKNYSMTVLQRVMPTVADISAKKNPELVRNFLEKYEQMLEEL